MPALFALGDKVIANPTISYFIAFGAFAMLLLVDFSGTRIDRLRSQTLLGIACIVMICLGTLLSRSTVLATLGMFVAAFVVLFGGVVSSVVSQRDHATLALVRAPGDGSGTGVGDSGPRRRLGNLGGGLARGDHDPVAVAGRLPGRSTGDRRLSGAGSEDPGGDRLGPRRRGWLGRA